MAPKKDDKKGDKKDQKKKRKSEIYKDARRDVRMSQQDYLDELDRAGTQATREYGQYGNQVGSLYEALMAQLGKTGNIMEGAFGDIQSGYGDATQDILGQLQGAGEGGSDQGEWLGMLGSMALAGQNQLTSDTARMQGFNTSAQTQGGIEGLTTQRNIQQDLRDYLDDISGERRDTVSQRDDLIRQRIDELRQQRIENKIAREQLRTLSGNRKGTKKFFNNLPGGGNGGGGNQGGGGQGQGGGNQPPDLNANKLIQSILQGDRFGQLNQRKKAAVRGGLDQDLAGKYERVTGQSAGMGPYSQQNLVSFLKQISQNRRLADDPNGPGNPGR